MQPDNSTTSNNEAIRNVDVDTCFLIETFVAFTTGNTGVTPYIVNAALNAILSVVTTIANILVFLAIRKTTSLHLPSKLLLLSLVLTDLAVGSVAQPLFVMFLATKAKGLSDTGVLCFMIVSTKLVGGYMGCVSVMNLTAISLDRYIAFHYHLSYRKMVTTRRVCVCLVVIWSFAAFFTTSWLWNRTLFVCLGTAAICAGTFATLITYIKIYRGLRHQHGHQVQDQVQTEQRERTVMGMARYRRSASSMLWIFCLSTPCYMPYVCLEISRPFLGQSVLMRCIFEFTITIVYLNSCLNPFVYCLRLPEIRAIVKTLLKIGGQRAQR